MGKKKGGNRRTELKRVVRAANRKRAAKAQRRLVSGGLSEADIKALKDLAARAEFSENVVADDPGKAAVLQEARETAKHLPNGNVELSLPAWIQPDVTSTIVLSSGIKVLYQVEMIGDREVPHVSMSRVGASLRRKMVRRVLDVLGFLEDAMVSQNPASGVWHAWNRSWVRSDDVDLEALTGLNEDHGEATLVAQHSCPVGQQLWRDMLSLGDGSTAWTPPTPQDRQRWARQVLAAQGAPERPVLHWEGSPADEREIYVRELLEAQMAHLVCCPVCLAAHEAVESGAMA